MPHTLRSLGSRHAAITAVVLVTLATGAIASSCGSSATNDTSTNGATTPGAGVGPTTAEASTSSTLPSSSGTKGPTSSVTRGQGTKPTSLGSDVGPAGTNSTGAGGQSTTTTAPGTDPGTLPQTEDKPTASGQQFDDGAHALWNAITTDDPDKALSFFFPLSAYKQVKGIPNPEHDYQTRLIANYKDDIHTLHAQLGVEAPNAQFVRLDVPATAAWIRPGVEYNKGAYFRVFDSRLQYNIGAQQRSFMVKSMISWRGQWYVVHLSSVR